MFNENISKKKKHYTITPTARPHIRIFSASLEITFMIVAMIPKIILLSPVYHSSVCPPSWSPLPVSCCASSSRCAEPSDACVQDSAQSLALAPSFLGARLGPKSRPCCPPRGETRPKVSPLPPPLGRDSAQSLLAKPLRILENPCESFRGSFENP